MGEAGLVMSEVEGSRYEEKGYGDGYTQGNSCTWKVEGNELKVG